MASDIQKQIETLEQYKESVITEAVTKGLNPDVEMKDSSIEWIGEIPKHWKIARLKYLSLRIGDGLHGTPIFSDDCVYFINGNNLGKEKIEIKENTDTLSVGEKSKYKQPILTNNTILIALNGTYGITSFYNNENILLGKSAGYVVLEDDINKFYIRYYLSSMCSKIEMDLSLSGTTIANLSLKTLSGINIVLPTNDEQIEIVSYLNEKCTNINKILGLKKQQLETLTQYKKSLIYEYVTGKKEVPT